MFTARLVLVGAARPLSRALNPFSHMFSCFSTTASSLPGSDKCLKIKLKTELMVSMRAKDKRRVTVIKSVLADILNAEKSGEAKKPSVGALIQKGIKRRDDAAKAFGDGGRDDLAAVEAVEKTMLESLLPPQMTAGEMQIAVTVAIASAGATSVADLGKVMKVLNGELDVSVAPRQALSAIAKELLGKK